MRAAHPRNRRRSQNARRIRTAPAAAISAALFLFGGCQAPQPPDRPTAATFALSDYDRFYDATLTTLRRYDFAPDRVDRVAGLIVSEPTTSAQWFEVWRVDAPGGYQLLESSLHTVRRTVTVKFERSDGRPAGMPEGLDQGPGRGDVHGQDPANTGSLTPPIVSGQYRVVVQVDKERRVSPERQINTASGALAIQSERVPTVEGERGPKSRRWQWVPLGRDGLLETWLLDKLAGASPAGVEVITLESDETPAVYPVGTE